VRGSRRPVAPLVGSERGRPRATDPYDNVTDLSRTVFPPTPGGRGPSLGRFGRDLRRGARQFTTAA
jgi:hypothetical protein